MCLLGFLTNLCQIIIFFILKSDNIENSRIELKGIVLQVPSNQIKVTFIIILHFNLVRLWFFHIELEQKCGWIIGGGGGGGKGYVGPPSQIIGEGLPPPPPPPPSYAYANDFLQFLSYFM